ALRGAGRGRGVAAARLGPAAAAAAPPAGDRDRAGPPGRARHGPRHRLGHQRATAREGQLTSFLSFCETGAGRGRCDNRRMPMPTVAIDVPSAQVLADQASIISELQFVMDCCKRLLTELDKPEEERDQLMPLALWSSAVRAY